MRIFLLTLCLLSLLTTTGCIFVGGRDHDDRDRDHWQNHSHDDHFGGVDHGVDHGEHPGEHPGDMNHEENR